MNRKIITLTICLLCVGFFGCAGVGAKAKVKSEAPKIECPKLSFTPPAVPALITDPVEQLDYVVQHYWDNYNFKDSLLLANKDITDQAFSNFLYMLMESPHGVAQKGVNTLLGRAFAAEGGAFERFTDLFELYFYDPNSPCRNEELYIEVLNYIVGNEKIEPINKIRPESQLRMALKNRVGAKATDFEYTLKSGAVGHLYDLNSDYTLLFFNNPDCHDCARVKKFISSSVVFNELCAGGELEILSIYPDADLELWKSAKYPSMMINGYDADLTITSDELYDLKAIPTLYLLDAEKRVILKDAPVEGIEMWLDQINPVP